MSTTQSETAQPKDSAPIIAGPGVGYRVKFAIFAAVVIGFGAWFGYDGFIGWPRMNQQIRDLKAQREHASGAKDKELLEQLSKLNNGAERTESDLLLQKVLCFALPPLGLIIFLRAMRNSRGQYRLENNILHVPGHPPVPLDNITEIDRRLWDRKGIVYLDYGLNDGATGTIRLDDYFHDRPPTDEIFKRIEEYVLPAAEQNSPSEKASQ